MLNEYSSNMSNNNSSYTILQELEMERKRIARELHDSTIQMLTMLIYKAEFCEQIVEKDAIRTKMELQIMIGVLKESIDDIRNTIYNLHPMAIEDLGLISSLERYLIQLNQDSKIEFALKVIGMEKECPPIVNISIYRIIQECCNNILKHSKGNKACIYITYSEDMIDLEVQDNGVGFSNYTVSVDKNDSNNLEQRTCNNDRKSGFGIPMMKERVALLNGNIKFQSNKDGAIVKVRIPFFIYKEEKHEDNKNDCCR